MLENSAQIIYGSTGEIGRDGLLTPELQLRLNQRQERAANIAVTYMDGRSRKDPFPIVAMATGVGKGRIIHLLIEKQLRMKPDSRILVIAGTKLALVDQSQDSLAGYQRAPQSINFRDEDKQEIIFNQTNQEHSYIESEDDEELVEDTTNTDEEEKSLSQEHSLLYTIGKWGKTNANVQIATIQTIQQRVDLTRRLEQSRRTLAQEQGIVYSQNEYKELLGIKGELLNPDDYDFVIVDEVHNIGTPQRVAAVGQFKRVVGFTATPYRHSGRMKSPEEYGFTIVDSLSLPEAQEERYLPPLLGVQIDTKDLVDEIPVNINGNIDFKKLEQILKKSPDLRPFIADRVANIIRDPNGKNYKTVIACNFVWEAQELAQLLHDKGIKVGVAVNKAAARAIHNEEIPALDSIERYKLPESDERSVQVLISPYVASEGFDAPFTEVLVWASPTDSDLRYTQYTGRLARRANGKLFGVIVDCLYQTSQYGWSFNMAMWMKGEVRQLENGLLYLGPESDIEELKNLPVVTNFRAQADIKPQNDLEVENLEEIQEGDFNLNTLTFLKNFVGDHKKIKPLRDQLLILLREKYPGKFAIRKFEQIPLEVFVDRELLLQEAMQIGLKQAEELTIIQETDFPLTVEKLTAIFFGNHQYLREYEKQALKIVLEENPSLRVTRRNGKNYVSVLTDSTRFKEEMCKLGAILREEVNENPPENGIKIEYSNIRRYFQGDTNTNVKVATYVLASLRSEGLVVYELRKSRNAVPMPWVIDKKRFLEEMKLRGIKLRSTRKSIIS
jgi:superfamily II DNA or RNA helicase